MKEDNLKISQSLSSVVLVPRCTVGISVNEDSLAKKAWWMHTVGAHTSESTAFLHHSRRAGLGGGSVWLPGNAEVAPFESLPIKTPTVPVCSELW